MFYAITAFAMENRQASWKILREAVESGNIDVIRALIPQNPHDTLIRVCSNAARIGNMDVLKWTAESYESSVGSIDSRGMIAYYLTRNNHADELKTWVTEHKGKLQGDEVFIACSYGSVACLKWLLGYNRELFIKHYVEFIHPRHSDEILELLHAYEIPGRYKEECKREMCKVCRSVVVWNLWEMLDPSFDNYIQWLPREMIEDTLLIT